MKNDRGMMKYIPYQSLTEQSSFLQHMRYEKGKTEKPAMFDEKAALIDSLLSNYHGQEVLLTYHRDGYPHEIKGIINRIYAYGKCLIIENEEVHFEELVDLEEVGEEKFYFD